MVHVDLAMSMQYILYIEQLEYLLFKKGKDLLFIIHLIYKYTVKIYFVIYQ